MPTSKKITVTIARAGHQYGATLTLSTALTGSAVIYRDGKRIASTGWDEEGFTERPLIIAHSTDDSEDALAALKRALVDRLMKDETYSRARAALFA